jgi:hypothetical protein
MRVIAVIADIVSSKAVARRGAFQLRLAKLLLNVGNDAYQLASPYTITLGDEFQAVYRSGQSILADVVSIMAEIHPVRARFSFGVGELTTRINPRQALGMDGPAFHRARAGLARLKKDRRLLRIEGDAEKTWDLANHTLGLLSHQMKGWSRNRLLILAGLLRGKSVKEIEDGLKISRVAVYKNIRAAALDDVVGICHELGRLFSEALREP